MSEGQKKPLRAHNDAAEARNRVIHLWMDLSQEERDLLIKQTKEKMRAQEARRLHEAELALRNDIAPPPLEGEPAKVRKPSEHLMRYVPTEYPDDLADAWEDMCGLSLDDGWLRMACLHKLFGLCFFIRERYEDAWLGYSFSRKVKTVKGMKVWPRRASSKANPFKWASIYEVQIVKFEWHEDLEQYKVVLNFDKGVTQTYWFKAEFTDVPMGEGWVRPNQTSMFNPL